MMIKIICTTLLFFVFVDITFCQTTANRNKVTAEHLKKFDTVLPAKATATPLKTRKVLIFQTFKGWRPPAVDFVDSAFVLLGRKTRAFEVTQITGDTSIFASEKLKLFDVVVLNNTNEMKLNANQSEALQNFVKQGKGLFALGSAISIQYWPEHAEMLGGFCFHHPFERSRVNSNNEWPIKIDDPSFPFTKMFSDIFLEKEVIYQIVGPYSRQDRRVLMSVNISDIRTNEVKINTNFCRKDNDYAVEWIRQYGLGRIFFTQMTHINSELMFSPLYLQHFLDMLQFTAGDLQADVSSVPVRTIAGVNKPKTLEQNLAILQDKNVTDRVNAIIALGEFTSSSEVVIPALIGLLKDEAIDIRYFAAKSLGKFAPEAVPAIAKLLVSSNLFEKSGALTALGFSRVHASPYLKDVTDLLTVKDLMVKIEAVYALGRIAPTHTNTIPLLVKMLNDSIATVREATAQTLAEMGPAAKAALPAITQSILMEKDNRTRRLASDVAVLLAEVPESSVAITAMVSMLKGDWQNSMKAIVNFGRLGEYAKPAIPELIKLLNDERAETRAGAAMALGMAGKVSSDAIPVLHQLLQDKERLVRLNAADALSKIGEKATSELEEMVSSSDWYVRLKALEGLVDISKKTQKHYPGLQALLTDNDPEVRRIALLNKSTKKKK